MMMSGAEVATCAGSAQYGAAQDCMPEMIADGALCCSGGELVRNLLGRAPPANCFGMPVTCGSGVTLSVTVPADDLYDVTWWYHCGNNDRFDDFTCGGLTYDAGSPGVCRPHEIVVNGALQTGAATGQNYYQFPCWPDTWAKIHPAVTTLRLKAGSNTLFLHTPVDYIDVNTDNGLDSVDLDVIHVTPVGKGTGTHVTPVAKAN
jgi:hypothetical protein